jgi:hypothetical protein
MKAFYVFLVCLMLAGCGGAAQQPPTATVTVSPTDTPTPNLTATYKAIRAATLTKSASNFSALSTQRAVPMVTGIAYAASMLDEISSAATNIDGFDEDSAILSLGPRDGEIKDADDDFVGVYDTDLTLANFVVSIKFTNPYDTATQGQWDYGLFFRHQTNNQYRLTIFSNQSWNLLHWGVDDRTHIYGSNDKNLTAKVGEENTVWLIVIDKKVHLFINGIHARSMNLGDGPSRGGLFPATGMYYGNDNRTGSTHFRDFTVWQLP